jgi:hypothetical protein
MTVFNVVSGQRWVLGVVQALELPAVFGFPFLGEA